MTEIRVDSLVFDYPGRRALDEVSFTVPQGSVTALVGPNGAGKTTLLRCLAGLERPISGTIYYDSLSVLEDPRSGFARTGYLHDSFGLYPYLTVAQCLRHAAAMRGAKGKTEAQWVAAAAARLGLEGRMGERAASLSRGWKQRVGIAQAIVHTPQVLILDEPASGLDPDARVHLSSLVRELRQSGMTIIVSSHILTELEAYSTHMLTIANGRILNMESLEHHASLKRQVRVTLSADWTGWEAALVGVADLVPSTTQTARQVELLVPADDAALAEVLARLIRAGAPVCGFVTVQENMEQRYLRLVQDGSQGGQS